jgi:hypothetical protein
MPRNLVSPLQVAFLALAMTSNVINPFVSWDVRFLGNSVWTSNNGFMGNLPYGYPEYSLPSSITNRTLRWLRQQINGSNHEKMNIFIKMPTIFNLDHTNGQTWWCVGNTKLRYSLKKKNYGINNTNSMNNANYVHHAEPIQMHRIIPWNIIISNQNQNAHDVLKSIKTKCWWKSIWKHGRENLKKNMVSILDT